MNSFIRIGKNVVYPPNLKSSFSFFQNLYSAFIASSSICIQLWPIENVLSRRISHVSENEMNCGWWEITRKNHILIFFGSFNFVYFFFKCGHYNFARIDSDVWINHNSFHRVVRFGAIKIEMGRQLGQHRQLVVTHVVAIVIYAIVNWNQLFSIIVKVQQLFSIKVIASIKCHNFFSFFIISFCFLSRIQILTRKLQQKQNKLFHKFR